LMLCTGEVNDYFRKLLEEARISGTSDITRLTNIVQLALSSTWLLYSIVIMFIGILRRYRPLRLLSILVFGLTILKIFFHDLSFLETLYRIFSFIGLGIILLAASYLYQRNKDVILGSGGAGTTPAP
jgi:uncharacterized membrane protein